MAPVPVRMKEWLGRLFESSHAKAARLAREAEEERLRHELEAKQSAEREARRAEEARVSALKQKMMDERHAHEGVAKLAAVLDSGADVNAHDVHGETLLFAAVESPPAVAAASIRFLIERGADPNLRVRRRVEGACVYHGPDTPLLAAVKKRNAEAVVALIERGANVKIPNSHSPLHRAVCNDYADICSILIARGADVNAQDEEGDTPLHVAGKQRATEELTAQLLKAGADVTKRNKKGEVPVVLGTCVGCQQRERLELTQNYRGLCRGCWIKENRKERGEKWGRGLFGRGWLVLRDEVLVETRRNCSMDEVRGFLDPGEFIFVTYDVGHVARQDGTYCGVTALRIKRLSVDQRLLMDPLLIFDAIGPDAKLSKGQAAQVVSAITQDEPVWWTNASDDVRRMLSR